MEINSNSALEMQMALLFLLDSAGMPNDGTKPITPTHIREAVTRLKNSRACQCQQQASSDDIIPPPVVIKHEPAAQTDEPLPTPVVISASKTAETPLISDNHQYVLIAGQLGIIIHQLKQAINRYGAEVAIAKNMPDAMAEFKKRDYTLVIIDLNMPTEQDGLFVLNKLAYLSERCDFNTEILVLAPTDSTRNIREICYNMGATVVLEKTDGWQQAILQCFEKQAARKIAQH